MTTRRARAPRKICVVAIAMAPVLYIGTCAALLRGGGRDVPVHWRNGRPDSWEPMWLLAIEFGTIALGASVLFLVVLAQGADDRNFIRKVAFVSGALSGTVAVFWSALTFESEDLPGLTLLSPAGILYGLASYFSLGGTTFESNDRKARA